MSERDIFIAALQKDNPAERQAYLDEACARQPELHQQVENLLRLYEGAGSFLQNPAAESAATGPFQDAALQASSPEVPGAIIGPYKLIEQIGEGGMGTVWMAQQTEPVKRLVAVKLIKAGMDSKQVIARFEAERQALALMDHPNIAKVLDAGTGPSSMDDFRFSIGTKDDAEAQSKIENRKSKIENAGRPYFVMDLVKGVPITKYCDAHHLTPRQRLELFIPVCQAVQHAHQKGIIHRDLKPSNVLVALYDGKPVPKVIDFGVAKAAGQSLTEKTLVTGFGTIVGTLEYMSPEQAEVNQLDIDTRSDVYSLGVLLYELLTGSPPFTRKELEKEGGVLEMLRVIREQEPTKPSTKLSTAEGLPTLAANRGTEPAKLARLVRGELDWIVMKALEKDRSRRYETANGLAADAQRHLNDEPVLACPPSAGYRLRKFARRNKTRLVMASVIGVALLLAVGLLWMARDRTAQRGRNVTAVEALLGQCEKALKADRTDQADIALGAAERRAADGGAEELAGRMARCRADLALLRELEAIDAYRFTLLKDRFPDLKAAAARWWGALTAYGVTTPDGRPAPGAAERVNGSLARDRILTALDLWLGADPSAGVRAVLRAADPDPYRDDVRDAVAAKDGTAVRALAADAKALAQPARFAAALGHLGWIPWQRRRVVVEAALRARPGDLAMLLMLDNIYPQGPQWAAQRVRWLQAAVAVHPNNAAAHNNLAIALDDLREFDAAVAEFKEAIRLDPTNAATHHTNLGATLANHKDLDGAIAEYRKALRIDPKFAVALTNWGRALAAKKNLEGAIAKHWEAIKIDRNLATARNNLGMALTEKADLDGAAKEYEKALQIDPKSARAHTNLGVIRWRKNDLDGALKHYERAIRLNPGYATAHTNRGIILWTKGKRDEAMVEFREAIRSDPEDAHAHSEFGKVLLERGELAEALLEARQAARLDPQDADSRCTVGNVLAGMGKLDGAIAEYREVIRIDPKHLLGRTNLAISLVKKGKPALALPLFQDVATEMEKGGFRNDKAVTIVNHFIDCHERLKQFDRAEPWRRKLLAVVKEQSGPASPPYAAQLTRLGRNLWRQHKWAGAIEAYNQALAINPKDARAWYGLGLALRDGKDLPGAIDAYKQALAINSQNARAWYNLGRALRRTNDPAGAVAAYRKAVAIDRKDVRAWTNLGAILYENHDLPGAIDAFKNAVAVAPRDAETWNNLGGALKAAKDLPGALAAIRKAVAIDDQYATAWANLGIVLTASEDEPGAIAAYQKAVALDGRYAMAHNGLAWLLATCPDARLRDPRRAVELARKAVRLARKNPTYPNTLGVASYRAGDWNGAIAALENSMRLRKGGDSFDWFFLAMAHWRLGEKDKARRWHDRAVRWMEKNQPKDEQLRRFRTEAAELVGIEKEKPK